jgi:Cu+-exporting ATPase
MSPHNHDHSHKPEYPADDEAHECCHNKEHSHDTHNHEDSVTPSASAKYFCPMCEGVESDKPGDCPKCGMRLERNPTFKAAKQATIWTCPMHPEIQEPKPGACPKCGMDLEPMDGSDEDDEEAGEINSSKRKMLVAAILTVPILLLAFGNYSGLFTENS